MKQVSHMEQDMSVKVLENATRFYRDRMCNGMLWFASNHIKWLTRQQQIKLQRLTNQDIQYSPAAVTLDDYFNRYINYKKLADDLINFYQECYPLLKTDAPKMVAWRWWNILDTEQQYRNEALSHNWSENLDKFDMHNMKWWHGTGNPYCVCIH